MKIIETYLPVFNGFYCTIFEAEGEESEHDHINEERSKLGLREVEFDELVFDYKDYMYRVASKCCEVIESELTSIIGEVDIEFQNVVSPSYYNFSNDTIDIAIELKSLDAILEYISENRKEFDQYIKDHYTSYDGFFSSYPNDSTEWLKDFNEEGNLGHKLGSVLNFILRNEDFSSWDLHDGLDGENWIGVSNYNELTTIQS